jgi:hypothetical protein
MECIFSKIMIYFIKEWVSRGDIRKQGCEFLVRSLDLLFENDRHIVLVLRKRTLQLLTIDWKRCSTFVDWTSMRTYYKIGVMENWVQISNVEIIHVTEIYKILLSIYCASESQII